MPESRRAAAKDLLLSIASGGEENDLAPIDRQALVALARACGDAVDKDAAIVQLWVATMMWGSGTSNGRGPWRLWQSLCDDRLTDTLHDTWRSIQQREEIDSIGTAYKRFNIHGVGPSFSTKWLWVSSLTSPTATGNPLIFDLRVRQSLTLLLARSAVPSADRPVFDGAVGYVNYISLIDDIVRQLDHDSYQSGVTAEKVEWLLFARARESATNLCDWLGTMAAPPVTNPPP
jgi:hypothetical protein